MTDRAQDTERPDWCVNERCPWPRCDCLPPHVANTLEAAEADRAQDTEAIRAALEWLAMMADDAPENSTTRKRAETLLAERDRLVARLEAAERERDEAQDLLAESERAATSKFIRLEDEVRRQQADLAAARAALAAAAPSEEAKP